MGFGNSVLREFFAMFADEQWKEISLYQVLILSGLPGCGKSYIARKLQKRLGASYLSSDGVRVVEVWNR